MDRFRKPLRVTFEDIEQLRDDIDSESLSTTMTLSAGLDGRDEVLNVEQIASLHRWVAEIGN
jgi:hypothetical protein